MQTQVIPFSAASRASLLVMSSWSLGRSTWPNSSVPFRGIKATWPFVSSRCLWAWAVAKWAVHVHGGRSLFQSCAVASLLNTVCTECGLDLTTLDIFLTACFSHARIVVVRKILCMVRKTADFCVGVQFGTVMETHTHTHTHTSFPYMVLGKRVGGGGGAANTGRAPFSLWLCGGIGRILNAV